MTSTTHIRKSNCTIKVLDTLIPQDLLLNEKSLLI